MEGIRDLRGRHLGTGSQQGAAVARFRLMGVTPEVAHRPLSIIGLMSGTSLDAIDAALVRISHSAVLQPDTAGRPEYQIELRDFCMMPMPDGLRDRVRMLLPPCTGSTREVCEADVLLGQVFGEAASAVADRAGIAVSGVDLIASHGQTVYHQMAAGHTPSTLQLGNAAVISERTGCTVVSGFRSRDIAAGGQGAPLIPYLDLLQLRHPQKTRAIQNIGGMANVTYLPVEGPPIAFDTGPGNVLINEGVRLLSGGAVQLDEDGRMAATGRADLSLVKEWLEHPYFARKPPKSTGREEWGPSEAAFYVRQCEAAGLSREDVAATLTAFTAHSIAGAYRAHLGRVDEVLVAGGGARNPTLMKMLQDLLAPAAVAEIGTVGIDADAREAVAFAVMAYATLHGWCNNVPSATGAARPVVQGSITPGNNYVSLMRLLFEV